MKTILLLLAVVLFSQNCSNPEMEQKDEHETTAKIQNDFPVVIGGVYFENWTSGVRGGGAGINLFIEFKAALPKEIVLKQLYFRDKKSSLNQLTETSYVSRFLNADANPKDNIVLSYEARNSEKNSASPPFVIKDNQAVLEYFKNEELNYYLISDIKELPLQFYPE